MKTRIEYREQMNVRLKKFALRVIKLFQSLPKTDEARIIGKQLLRSGTSVAANYRAACRAGSGNEFYSKISIVVEEADESLFWFELLTEAEIISVERMKDLMQEAEEIVKIMSTARKNAQPK
ncbi:MAG: four helix bundle protein [Paludibacter sp.]|nr:four helix bundle protein [Paludibacter sp.]